MWDWGDLGRWGGEGKADPCGGQLCSSLTTCSPLSSPRCSPARDLHILCSCCSSLSISDTIHCAQGTTRELPYYSPIVIKSPFLLLPVSYLGDF